MSRRYLIALLAAAFLLVWNLGYAPLWNPDEGRYASASLEMVQPFNGSAPDYIVPHLNTLPRLNKPPMVYWLTGGFIKLFGTSAAAVRLTSALAAVGVMLILWQLGRRMFDEKTGVSGALVWATAALPFVLSHTLNTDVLLTFCFTLSAFGLWRLSHEKGVGPPLLAGLGLGLALITKGPVGVVLPVGAWGIWFLLTRRGKAITHLPGLALVGAFAVMLIVGAPWYVAIGKAHPEFLKGFLFGENIARLTGSKFYHNPHPFWFYLPVILLGLFPWTAFIAAAIARIRLNEPETQQARDNRWFLWIWAAVVLLLFSISKVKLVTYILPAMPAFALLIGEAVAATSESTRNLVKKCAYFTGGLLFLTGAALPVAFVIRKGLGTKLIPLAEVSALLVIITVAAFAGAVLLFRYTRQENQFPGKKIIPVVFVTGFVLFSALLAAAGRASRYEDPSPILVALQPYLKPTDEFVEFKTFQPTAIFYLNRPVTVFDFANTSGLGEDEYKSSSLFPQDHKILQDMLKKAERENRTIYILAKWKHIHWPSLHAPGLPALRVIAQNNDYRLLSNREAPPGFSYEHITPFQQTRPLSPACKAISPLC